MYKNIFASRVKPRTSLIQYVLLLLLRGFHLLNVLIYISASGNWTRVICVTGRYTNHYTNADCTNYNNNPNRMYRNIFASRHTSIGLRSTRIFGKMFFENVIFSKSGLRKCGVFPKISSRFFLTKSTNKKNVFSINRS